MSNDKVEEFWDSFVEATGIDGPYEAWAFGNHPEMADSLGRLVLNGPKRATSSLQSSYHEENEPLPRMGDLSVSCSTGAASPSA
jgi:uncharacterized protein YhfF